MKWANKARLEIEGSVDALGRIMTIVENMQKHGATGHTFDVAAMDGVAFEQQLGQWDGDGVSTVTRLHLTEIPTGEEQIINL